MRLPFLLLLLLCCFANAQDRLQTMPRYDRYEKLRREIGGSVKRGDINPTWAEDGQSFTFAKDGKNYKYDIPSKQQTEVEKLYSPPANQGRRGGRARGNPERGRQFETVYTEDGKLKAFHRDRNVYLSDADGKNEQAITTDGSAAARTKYGVASWVYGEELGVREAMWFSPDGKKLAYYFFDESQVPDYFLTLDQGKIQNKLDVEAYPKAGAPNPKVKLFVYDLDSKKSQRIDVEFAGGDPDIAHYIYDVRWSPDGDELWFNRTNRKQNMMELCAANASTGKCRMIIRESNPGAWVENHPGITILDANPQARPGDRRRFLWVSERNGYSNIYLYDTSGKLINPVTQHNFEVGNIVKVDEAAKVIYYTARDGENTYRLQFHRVGFDGKGDKRLTDPAFSHTVRLAPAGGHFIDTLETIDTPPVTKLIDPQGKEVATLATSDMTKFDELGLKRAERFTFTAADGKTVCYGYLQKPSDFDASKKYPLIVSVYGGPESGGGNDRFTMPNPITEMGFLVCWIDGRGTSGRGKAHKDAVYGKLGVVEIDDQAAGVKELAKRPYVDGKRVGIYGTSYGGYSTVMALLRHPEVFHVGVAGSSVTDWRNYDTIYTERYMGLPSEGENKKGYDEGSAMPYAKNLKGRLLLYYGTADNNVHPTNTHQLILALDSAGKSYDVSVGPDKGHTGPNSNRMWEYFVDYLILKHNPQPLPMVFKQRAAERKAAK
jgi:dipeptidyl-peptidase 4